MDFAVPSGRRHRVALVAFVLVAFVAGLLVFGVDARRVAATLIDANDLIADHPIGGPREGGCDARRRQDHRNA